MDSPFDQYSRAQAWRAESASQALTVFDPRELEGKPIPLRRWIVPGWLPCGHVTLNFGDGGVGKTLLSQMLMTATALGTTWCGLSVERCASFGLFCEDDDDELHRRQEDILRHANMPYSELGAMRWASGAGADNTLVEYGPDGIGTPTARLTEITDIAVKHGARLVILDTCADLFGGNENDRRQVGNFVRAHLGRLARLIDGAVLLNAHPSRSGMSATGDMTSGSTGWSNTARSRWSLARPMNDDGTLDVHSDQRVLTRRKANYSGAGDEIALRWHNGVLVPLRTGSAGQSSMDARARAAQAEATFLDLTIKLWSQKMAVSASKNAVNFAPKVFELRPERAGLGRRDFETAMHRLFASGKIEQVQYGRRSDLRLRIGITEATASDVDKDGRPDAGIEEWRAASAAATSEQAPGAPRSAA